jgi:hypothetical protein
MSATALEKRSPFDTSNRIGTAALVAAGAQPLAMPRATMDPGQLEKECVEAGAQTRRAMPELPVLIEARVAQLKRNPSLEIPRRGYRDLQSAGQRLLPRQGEGEDLREVLITSNAQAQAAEVLAGFEHIDSRQSRCLPECRGVAIVTSLLADQPQLQPHRRGAHR